VGTGTRRALERWRLVLIPLLVAVLLGGCRTGGHAAAWRRYTAAVAATRTPTAGAVRTDLVTLATSEPDLRWDDQGRVLVATWTRAVHYTGTAGGTYTAPVDLWVTAVPFVQRFCRCLGHSGGVLDRRLTQLLGLPPDTVHDAFVEIWVRPDQLFRPCPDPEVTDRSCQVRLSGTPPPTDGCPWTGDQLPGSRARVAPEHLDWMCANWEESYPPGDPRTAYPWTGLGYTYDWGRPRAPWGMSEFVIPRGQEVEIRAVISTGDYCHRR
jgi:hypothetical protein